MKSKVVKVKISGQDYVVRSTAGQQYLERVAKYVDDKSCAIGIGRMRLSIIDLTNNAKA